MLQELLPEYILLAPGPVNLHPEVCRLLSLPMIHHRTPEFDQILNRVLKGLKTVFQTEQAVFMHSSTGSGGMESLLVNTITPGDSVLVIVSGKFGERWAQMAEIFGAKVNVLQVPWGEKIPIESVREQLRKNKFRAVLCQACETSSGTAHPIQEIGKLISSYPDTLFLVDGITAVGAYPLPMDEWHIDGLVAGSQKAFMLPTGLSFISFSKKAWSIIDKNPTPRFYFDIRQEKKANEKGETLFSSNVALVRALDFVLKEIQAQGLSSLHHSIHRRAQMTRHFAPDLKLKLYSLSPSDSLTALIVPNSMDSQKLRADLEAEHKITIMGGQDQAKGKILRVGHMGYITDEHMLRFFQSLGLVLRKHDPSLFTADHLNQTLTRIKIWMKANP